MKAVVRANENHAGIYATVTRIGRLAVGQTILQHTINTYGGEACLRALLASPHLAARRLIVDGGECMIDAAHAIA